MSNKDSVSIPVVSNNTTDGRSLRAQRTVQAIAEAYLELLRAGDLRPPIRDIAASAGVSERAVFRHFQDSESLFDAVAKMHLTRVMAEIPELVDAGEPFAKRMISYLERWCWVFERVTPVRRAANLNEPFSREIKRRHNWARGRRTEDFEGLFDRELSRMSKHDRRDIIDAASAMLGWPTWEHLRTHRKLSVERATEIMMRTLKTILSGRF
jgi:AcrR family transcriptional regulator